MFDIDVAALHQGYLRQARRNGGVLALRSRTMRIARSGTTWQVEVTGGGGFHAPILVNAAGAWGDEVAVQAGSITALQLNNLAWLYYENKDTRALPTARQALELSGRQADVLDTLGWILVQQSKLNEGLPYLEEAFRGNNRQPEIAYHLAYAQAHSGKPVPARALLASLLSTPTAFPSRKEAEALLASLKAAGN